MVYAKKAAKFGLACGRCGRRMAAKYPNGGRFQRYACSRAACLSALGQTGMRFID
jgi:hypothetical protein